MLLHVCDATDELSDLLQKPNVAPTRQETSTCT